MKDFVKKIKLEDARIDQRKKTLARTAERIALAKAKASAAAIAVPAPVPAPASPIKEPATPKETNAPLPDAAKPDISMNLSPSTLLSGGRSPLHPSLPAKPGLTSPLAKPTSAQELPPAKPAAVPSPAPTPVQAPVPSVPAPVAPSPVPVALPADDQINRLEEVRLVFPLL